MTCSDFVRLSPNDRRLAPAPWFNRVSLSPVTFSALHSALWGASSPLRQLQTTFRNLMGIAGGRRVVAETLPHGWADSLAASGTPEERLRVVFEHSSVGIALLDPAYGIVHANAAFARFLGYELSELHGRPITHFSSSEDAVSTASMLSEVGSGSRASGAVEARFLRRDESIGWGALSVSLAGNSPESLLVAVLQDVTERKVLEEQLMHRAYHDPLTELPNRALFRDRVVHALSRQSRNPERIAVIFLDLDNFKDINDTQGHGAGDRFLHIVAQRIVGATRGCDTVARVGGDEFAV
ncbi:MAG: diguanylate cyclase, partial [Gemmatimonadaceae bacterium]